MGNVSDPKVAFIQRTVDCLTIIRSYFPEYDVAKGLVMCHNGHDNKPSLHISVDGRAYCHGCGFKAGGIVDFVSKIEDIEYNETKKMLYNDLVKGVPDSLVEAYHVCLLKQNDAMKYLLSSRKLLPATIEDARLGYEPASSRILIPVFDQFKTCVNIRRIGWLESHEEKSLNLNGKGQARLYPEDKAVLSRRLLLCEGEWDCLVAQQCGLPAVTWTNGANGWNEKFEYFFAGKAVWVLYDNDRAGIAGAKACFNRLKSLAVHVEIVTPPKLKGKDISDWYKQKAGVSFLQGIERVIRQYKFPEAEKQKCYCPHCGQEIKK